ncbi:hypothetical protein MSG28_010864, partial [Choristoneura fumiferana]
RGICVATIPPIRPIDEQSACIEFLVYVGNSSEVKTFTLSQLLSSAVYNCNWTAKSRYFKSSLRLFAERANKPLSITAGKMFPLSLTTFTSTLGKEKSEIKRKKAK